MIRRTGIAALLALALVLSGCAQLRLLGEGADAGSANAFEMQGRVYVRYGPKAFAGSLRWAHALSADEIWFSGPLGQTAAHLARDRSGATLTTADQQVYRSMSLETLTEQGLGWTFPVTDLSYYVLGELPPQAGAIVERDDAGRLARVEHAGWRIEWARRADGDRPVRLEMRKGDVEIRLVIDQLERQQ